MFIPSDTVGPGFRALVSNQNLTFIIIGILFSMPLIERFEALRYEDLNEQGQMLQLGKVALHSFIGLAAFLVCSVYVMAGTYNPFIYFRF